MKVPKLMKIMLLAYEIVRFVSILAGMLLIRWRDLSTDEVSWLWLSASPNVLFPLMAFFLLASLNKYRAYIPLFIAGKAAALALALCFFVKELTIFSNILSYIPITIGDAFSILVCISIGKQVTALEPTGQTIMVTEDIEGGGVQ